MVLPCARRRRYGPAATLIKPLQRQAAPPPGPSRTPNSATSPAFPAAALPTRELRVYRAKPSSPNGCSSATWQTKRNPRHTMARCRLRVRPPQTRGRQWQQHTGTPLRHPGMMSLLQGGDRKHRRQNSPPHRPVASPTGYCDEKDAD